MLFCCAAITLFVPRMTQSCQDLLFEANFSDPPTYIRMKLLEVELKVFHRNGEIRPDCCGHFIMSACLEITTWFTREMLAIDIEFKFQR